MQARLAKPLAAHRAVGRKRNCTGGVVVVDFRLRASREQRWGTLG